MGVLYLLNNLFNTYKNGNNTNYMIDKKYNN